MSYFDRDKQWSTAESSVREVFTGFQSSQQMNLEESLSNVLFQGNASHAIPVQDLTPTVEPGFPALVKHCSIVATTGSSGENLL